MLNIVLFEPEIPANTGNIARTCVGLNCKLHLIKPYGFHLDDKKMKRAGVDYWDKLNLFEYESFDDFINKNKISNTLFLKREGSWKTNNLYTNEISNFDISKTTIKKEKRQPREPEKNFANNI